MADVLPFRGLRYDVSQVGNLSDVTCPPYDVIDADFQNRLYQAHPCNVIRLELNRTEPGDADTNARYQRASRFLETWMTQGVLKRDPQPALYVYHQEFTWGDKTYVRKGFLGRIRLERFGEGRVFPHEQTLSGPKADRLLLLQACKVNFSPIFGLYPDTGNTVQAPLEAVIADTKPEVATDHLGVVHKLWPVTSTAAQEQVRSLLMERPIFIADGHHRYETAINYRDSLTAQGAVLSPDSPENFVMMMFVGMSDAGLVILPTHRLVSGLAGLKAQDVQQALAPNFDVVLSGSGAAGCEVTWKKIEQDGTQTAFGFGTAADGQWVFAKLRDGSPMKTLAADQSDDWRGLGVSILHKLALEKLIQPQATAAMSNQYVHQTQEVTDALAAKSCDLGCLVAPAGIDHVEQIASRLEKMPPKSTYFYPKLQTGLVFNPVT